jgi:hypothetical protein
MDKMKTSNVIWKQWKLPKTRIKKLISLSVPKYKAYEGGNSREKYWRIAIVQSYTEPSATPIVVAEG